MQTTAMPPRRALEFGIYRDGDNNLDAMQESAVTQAIRVSQHSPDLAFTVEDTTSQRFSPRDQAGLHTDDFVVTDGHVSQKRQSTPHEMSDPKNLAAFVARTLDNAEAAGAQQTWIDLVDHGGGDGGGLETSDGKVMSMPAIADAIAQGVAMHEREHPEDAGRHVDGVIANQCLMATLGFATGYCTSGQNVRSGSAQPRTTVITSMNLRGRFRYGTSVQKTFRCHSYRANRENSCSAQARKVLAAQHKVGFALMLHELIVAE